MRTLRNLILALLILVTGILILDRLLYPGSSEIEGIKVGMSKTEVIERLGVLYDQVEGPDGSNNARADSEGGDQGVVQIYRIAGTRKAVRIFYDAEEKVTMVVTEE